MGVCMFLHKDRMICYNMCFGIVFFLLTKWVLFIFVKDATYSKSHNHYYSFDVSERA